MRRGDSTRRELKGVYAVDAGPLIDLVYGSVGGAALRDALLDESVSAVTHELAITELRYILCRGLGRREAEARVEKLLASGYLLVEDVSALIASAADIKCERALSLPDCFTLSLARRLSVPCLFAGRERELLAEMERRAFDVDIAYLEDYA